MNNTISETNKIENIIIFSIFIIIYNLVSVISVLITGVLLATRFVKTIKKNKMYEIINQCKKTIGYYNINTFLNICVKIMFGVLYIIKIVFSIFLQCIPIFIIFFVIIGILISYVLVNIGYIVFVLNL